MTDVREAAASDRDLKSRHRAMWALGDYPTVATEVIPSFGPLLVQEAGVREGDRVLDVAAGSGNVAVAAARAGAHVVASDLTPELLEAGRCAAEAEGVALRWEQGDAEALPYADGSFDAVLSSVGVMFAPHHQQAADELLRVCRPGGALGLVSWTPEGFVGQMFGAMKPYAPPSPPGAQPAPLWGDEGHVCDLLGDHVVDLRLERRRLPVTVFADGPAFRDFFKHNYGPAVAVYASLGGDEGRLAGLDAALAELGDRHLRDGRMEWEYLLVTARRA